MRCKTVSTVFKIYHISCKFENFKYPVNTTIRDTAKSNGVNQQLTETDDTYNLFERVPFEKGQDTGWDHMRRVYIVPQIGINRILCTPNNVINTPER